MREGLKETLTITRFGISCQRALGRTLGSTNAIESMLSICRERARNVKAGGAGRWHCADGGAGMLDAERSFRRVKGFPELPKLQAPLHRHAADVDAKEVRDFPIAA